MKNHTDRDGKSKTASAVDAEHYPEQHEVQTNGSGENASHQEVAELAYRLWQQRGCPEGSAEQDWFDATEELREASVSAGVKSATEKSGSVQH